MRGLALAVFLVLSACSPVATVPSDRPASPTTPVVGPPAGEVSASTGTAPSVTLTCLDAIASLPRPSSHNAVVLGVVALPTSDATAFALQASRSGESDPAGRLFAKEGLEIKTGAAFEIVVPDEVANRFSIGWGNPGRRAHHVVVPGCDSSSAWLAYAGGYWVRQVGCLPLLVRAAGSERTVLIGVGAPCPGQKPPPQPTET